MPTDDNIKGMNKHASTIRVHCRGPSVLTPACNYWCVGVLQIDIAMLCRIVRHCLSMFAEPGSRGSDLHAFNENKASA